MKNLMPNKIAKIIILAIIGLITIFTLTICIEYPVTLARPTHNYAPFDIVLFGVLPLILLVVSIILMAIPFKKKSNILAAMILFNIAMIFISIIGCFAIIGLSEPNEQGRIIMLVITGVLPTVVTAILGIVFAVLYNNYRNGKLVKPTLIYVFGSLTAFLYLVSSILNYLFIKGDVMHSAGTFTATPRLTIVIGVFQIFYHVLFMLHKFDENEVWVPKAKPVYEAPEIPGDVQVVYVAHENTSPRRRTTAIMLCFFLGTFGAHRFYTGKIGTGILYILTLGGFTFGVTCDLIMLLFGMFRDKEGRTVRDEN